MMTNQQKTLGIVESEIRPVVHSLVYARVMGMDYMEELINIFVYIYSCDEFEAVREYSYPTCPICNAKADSFGDYIHLEGNKL